MSRLGSNRIIIACKYAVVNNKAIRINLNVFVDYTIMCFFYIEIYF